jgi:hypothetical protein
MHAHGFQQTLTANSLLLLLLLLTMRLPQADVPQR